MHRRLCLSPRLVVFAALAVFGAVGCDDEFSDEPFGVVDLAHLYDGGSPGNPAAGLPRQIDPSSGYLEGELAEYYDFGVVPVMFNALTRAPTGARVQQMYFFFTKDGYPLFSRPAREERDGVDWMKGGKNVLNPNPKNFCDGVQGDKTDCERLNADEKKKPYPARRRDPLTDGTRNANNYQRPLVDVSPQDRGSGPGQYTGFWEIVEVTVPNGYDVDAIKHVETLNRAVSSGKFKKRETNKVIDCPIVDERTYISRGVSDRKIFRPVIELWYKRRLAFCYLIHGWETLGNDDGVLYFSDQDAERVDTFDVSRVVVGDGATQSTDLIVPVGKAYQPVILPDEQSGALPTVTPVTENILTRSRPRHTKTDPRGYTPLRWMHTFEVPAEYVSGQIKSIDNVDMARGAPGTDRGGNPLVHNLALRGTLIKCAHPRHKKARSAAQKEREVCGVQKPDPNDPLNPIIDPKDDPECKKHGLECNTNTCFCDVPFVGYGQRCGPGVARCSPEKDEFSDSGYFCFPPWGGFCHLGCGGTNERSAENQGKDPKEFVDTRCKSVPGYVCYGRRFCIKYCDENVSDPGQCKAEARVGMETKDINEGMTCQNWGLTICTWPETYTPK